MLLLKKPLSLIVKEFFLKITTVEILTEELKTYYNLTNNDIIKVYLDEGYLEIELYQNNVTREIFAEQQLDDTIEIRENYIRSTYQSINI